MKHDVSVVIRIEGEPTSTSRKLDEVLRLLHQSRAREIHMAGELERLEGTIQPLTDAVEGASALLSELSRLIRENAQSPQRILAVADQIDARKAALAQAIVDNTPAAP